MVDGLKVFTFPTCNHLKDLRVFVCDVHEQLYSNRPLHPGSTQNPHKKTQNLTKHNFKHDFRHKIVHFRRKMIEI